MMVSLSGPSTATSTDYCYQPSHWGECLQGPVWHRGTLETALITMPRWDRGAWARFMPSGNEGLSVFPSSRTKSLAAAKAVLRRASVDIGGRLFLKNNLPSNGGAGTSTSEVTAAARATCEAVGFELEAEDLQRLVFEIEHASDPLALMDQPRTVIYGSRCGEIIDQIQASLPRMTCLGFVTDPTTTVLTESLIGCERYTAEEAIAFSRIITRAKRGIMMSRVDLIAKAATESARLNQCRVPTAHFNELIRIANHAGALGLSVSHSGVTAAAIFDPTESELGHRTRWMASCLQSLGCTEIETFTV